jgi:hypothetical protein
LIAAGSNIIEPPDPELSIFTSCSLPVEREILGSWGAGAAATGIIISPSAFSALANFPWGFRRALISSSVPGGSAETVDPKIIKAAKITAEKLSFKEGLLIIVLHHLKV